jgi:hypothetical protein
MRTDPNTRQIEWSFETDRGVYGQVASGVVFVFDEKMVPLTAFDEAAVEIEIGNPVMVRHNDGQWFAYDWGMVINTLRFRRA